MRRYPAYKPSGVDWLGEVPEGWRLSKIRYLARFLSGGTPARDNPEFWNGDIPWVSPKDMKSRLVCAAEENITEAGLFESATSLAETGSVLMVVRSGILKHTIPVALNTAPVAINQDLKAITFDPQTMLASYFAYFVEGYNDALLLVWGKQGATVESIEHQFLTETLIPLPTLPEQQAIAAFLDREVAKIDALVAEQRRLIELLAEKRQAVISHAVTKGLNPNARLTPSGIDWLGDIPEGWEVVRLGALFNEVMEPGAMDLPILSVSIHTGVSDEEIPEDDMDRKVTRSDDRTKYRSVRPGDLTYNMMRAWQGGFGAVRVNGMVSPAYVVARPTMPERILTEFVELLLRTPNAVTEMKRNSRGVTDFRLRLYWDEFKAIYVALPTVDDQRAILSAISDEAALFDSVTDSASSAITLLQERRAALISAAVTGKIDVRDTVSETTEAA